jgi:molybdopterin molybdotransferase
VAVGFVQLTSVARAIAWIDRAFPGHLGAERLPISEALGRVLARDVAAAIDAPPFDRALADGYAVEAEATLGASVYNPLTFRLGDTAAAMLPRAVRVAYGSPLPKGADAVVPGDHVQENVASETFELIEQVAAGANIERVGNVFSRTNLLLRAGRFIRPSYLGLLAEAGIGSVEVVRRPRIRVIVTGQDLIETGNELLGGAVFDADTPMLQGLVERDGGTVETYAADRRYSPFAKRSAQPMPTWLSSSADPVSARTTKWCWRRWGARLRATAMVCQSTVLPFSQGRRPAWDGLTLCRYSCCPERRLPVFGPMRY